MCSSCSHCEEPGVSHSSQPPDLGRSTGPISKLSGGGNPTYHISLIWNARVLLVSSELLAGVVFEGAVYSFQPLGY